MTIPEPASSITQAGEVVRRPKRVALLTHIDILKPGGVAHSMLRLARELSSNGIDVDLVTMDFVHETADFVDYRRRIEEPTLLHGIPVYSLRSWRCGLVAEDRWSAISAYNWAGIHLALTELQRARNYELLHGYTVSITGFAVAFAACEFNIPSIVSIRGADINRDIYYQDRVFHLVWALQRSTDFTAVSTQGLQRGRIISGCHLKGRAIFNSIRSGDFEDGIADLDLPRPLIGAVGEFKSSKGPEVLLASFELLRSRYPTAHLLVIGDGSYEERSYFRDLIQSYNLGRYVTVTGIVPHAQVLRYLRLLDVFVLPSLHDGCPNALLEAMLAGAPVVAARAGAVPDVLQHERDGILSDVASPKQLCGAIEQMLLSDTDIYRTNARRRVAELCHPKVEVDAYLKLYSDCMQKEPSSTSPNSSYQP